MAAFDKHQHLHRNEHDHKEIEEKEYGMVFERQHEGNQQPGAEPQQPGAPAQPGVQHVQGQSVPKIYGLFAILMAIIAYLVWLLIQTPQKIHCPNGQKTIYIPTTAKNYQIDASVNNPSNADYSWEFNSDYKKHQKIAAVESLGSLVSRWNKAILPITKVREVGYIEYVLTISVSPGKGLRTCTVPIRFYEASIIGIDLGTTYSCVAYQTRKTTKRNSRLNVRESKVVVLDQRRQEYCVPTAVYIPLDNKEILFGYDAREMLSSDPLNVFYDLKRIIGLRYDDITVEEFIQTHKFTCQKNMENNQTSIVIPNKNYQIVAPETILALFISNLISIAANDIKSGGIDDCVISIPAFFNNLQRKSVYSIAKLAGLNVKQLIVEPTSAALAYKYYFGTSQDKFKLFLVVDTGGGTTDVSVLRCRGYECHVRGINGNSALGGIDFDMVIYNLTILEAEKKHGIKRSTLEKDGKLNSDIMAQCENAKIILSDASDVEIEVGDRRVGIRGCCFMTS